MKQKKSISKANRQNRFLCAAWIVTALVGILAICILHAASGPMRVTKLMVDHKIIVPAEGILIGRAGH
jgi:hypothetical protein